MPGATETEIMPKHFGRKPYGRNNGCYYGRKAYGRTLPKVVLLFTHSLTLMNTSLIAWTHGLIILLTL